MFLYDVSERWLPWQQGCKYVDPEQVRTSSSQVAHILSAITSALVLTDLALPVTRCVIADREIERVLVTNYNYMLVLTTGNIPSRLDVIDR